jgi:DNA adenine methylase
MNKSPLRYPGGKSRACKKLDIIINKHFDITKFTTILSPFFGGGSFEFYLQNKYNKKIICNDKFKPLYNFWISCKNDKDNLCNELNNNLNITKSKFQKYRNKIMDLTNNLQQAIHYFIINRCSFSGSTLSGGFSEEASKKRFTKSSIDRIRKLDLTNFEIYNLDFSDFILNYYNDTSLLFLDPPYFIDGKLYGLSGDMNEDFDHEKLHELLTQKSHWILTYNDCKYIRNLYKNYIIENIDWSYGMNKSKKSSEIIIINK